jgi:hypothetical protein
MLHREHGHLVPAILEALLKIQEVDLCARAPIVEAVQ